MTDLEKKAETYRKAVELHEQCHVARDAVWKADTIAARAVEAAREAMKAAKEELLAAAAVAPAVQPAELPRNG